MTLFETWDIKVESLCINEPDSSGLASVFLKVHFFYQQNCNILDVFCLFSNESICCSNTFKLYIFANECKTMFMFERDMHTVGTPLCTLCH